jgi:hypothetical protein
VRDAATDALKGLADMVTTFRLVVELGETDKVGALKDVWEGVMVSVGVVKIDELLVVDSGVKVEGIGVG